MSKRALVLILILICSLSLTGCGFSKFKKQVSETIDNIATNVSETYEEAKKAKTKDALTTEERNRAEAESYEEQSGFTKFGYWLQHPISKENRIAAYADKHEDEVYEKYDEAINDKKLAAKEERNEQLKDMAYKINPMVIIVILIVVVAFLVLIFILLRSRQQPRVRAKTPASKKDVKTSGDVNVRYERLLRENCSKLGKDYDTTLKEYGDDLRTAVDATNLQVFSGK